MYIIIKLKNYLEDTKVSVMITKPNAENAYYEKYLFLKYYFVSQQNNPDHGFS